MIKPNQTNQNGGKIMDSAEELAIENSRFGDWVMTWLQNLYVKANWLTDPLDPESAYKWLYGSFCEQAQKDNLSWVNKQTNEVFSWKNNMEAVFEQAIAIVRIKRTDYHISKISYLLGRAVRGFDERKAIYIAENFVATD